jgi:hypothetical protein
LPLPPLLLFARGWGGRFFPARRLGRAGNSFFGISQFHAERAWDGRVRMTVSAGVDIALTFAGQMPREKRDRIERFEELHGFLNQSVISAKNIARLKALSGHEDLEVAAQAALILEIARVLPGKRNRWLKLVQRHRPIFDRTVAFLGVEFFEELLAGYGDFDSLLWDILEEY